MKKFIIALVVALAMMVSGVSAQTISSLNVDSIQLTPTSVKYFCSYSGLDVGAFARIFYGKTSLDSVSNYFFIGIGSGTFILQIAGLTPNTSYHWFLKVTYPFTFDGDSGTFVTQPLITGIQPEAENTLSNQEVNWYNLSGQLITTGSKEDFYNLYRPVGVYLWRGLDGSSSGKIFIGH